MRMRKAYSEGFLRGPLQQCVAQSALSSSKQHFQQVALQPCHQALALRVPKPHIVLQQPRLRSMHPCFRVWLWLHLIRLASRHPFWARSSIYSLQWTVCERADLLRGKQPAHLAVSYHEPSKQNAREGDPPVHHG